MIRKLLIGGLAALLFWPTGLVLADDDDAALKRLEQRISDLVRLEAGTYECGGSPLAMVSGVDLEGAGVSATRILGNPVADDTAGLPSGGVINGASGMEIRGLTVEHTGDIQPFAIGIDNLGASMRITDVDVIMSNQRNVDFGIVAMDAQFAIVLRDVRVEAGTVGILTGVNSGFDSMADFGNVTVTAREAMSGNFGGSAVVRDSVLAGSDLALRTAGTSFSFTATQLSGPIDAMQGLGPHCVASFDADFVPLDETCGTGIAQTAQ